MAAQNYTSPEEVVREALHALEKEHSSVVPGVKNQLQVNIPRFLPRETLVTFVSKLFKA